MSPELIENTYNAFSEYRLGADHIDFAAAVDVNREENERLHQTLISIPLRSLPPDAVCAYFDYVDAAHYDGQFHASEFRYFLPRALELIVLEHRYSTSWSQECIERSLSRASAPSVWPIAEIAAIKRILALWPENR
jgi:hypothetical protein